MSKLYGLRQETARYTNAKMRRVVETPVGGKVKQLPKSRGKDDTFLFTMLGNMGASTGTAEIRTMDDSLEVEASTALVNTLGDFGHLVTDDRGVCVKVGSTYYAVHPEAVGSVSKAHVFTLTASLAGSVGATATATVLASGESGVLAGDVITVRNTGGKKSFTGAVGTAVKVGSQYWVVEVDQYPILSLITLNADTHTFSPGSSVQGKVADQAAISVSSMVATTPYPFAFVPSPLPTIHNPHNFIGLSGDKAIVHYNEDQDRFEIIEMLPAEKRRMRFKLSDDMPTETVASTTDITVLEAREFTAGEVDVPIVVYDPMRLIVNGETDDEGIAEYSYRNGVWQVISFRKRTVSATPHYLFTLTGTITGGGGAATIRNLADDTEIATGQTVNDPLGHFEGLTSGYRGICFKQDGEYYALGPYVTKVRWQDPDLQYSRNDGSLWFTIDTAQDCT